jgi:hypothetical protein
MYIVKKTNSHLHALKHLKPVTNNNENYNAICGLTVFIIFIITFFFYFSIINLCLFGRAFNEKRIESSQSDIQSKNWNSDQSTEA